MTLEVYFSSKAWSCACWVGEIGSGGAVIGCRPNSLPGLAAWSFCAGSVGTDWTAVGAGAGMAVGAAGATDAAGVTDAAEVVAAGVSPSVVPAGRLPEGGGTGAKKLFPELAVVGAAGSVGWAGASAGEASMVGAGGGVAGTAAPEGVTTTGVGWGCAGTALAAAGFASVAGGLCIVGAAVGAAAAGWAGAAGMAGAAPGGFWIGGGVGETAAAGAGWAGCSGILGAGVCAFVGADGVSNSRSFSSSAARAAAWAGLSSAWTTPTTLAQSAVLQTNGINLEICITFSYANLAPEATAFR